MCGDWHIADDVVSTVALKAYVSWRRISRMENVDAYVRRMILNALINEKRRPWRRERSTPEVPLKNQPASDRAVDDRLSILSHLNALPARKRAVVVLRFYCDLSVDETAEVLECSAGTVKSQTARALEMLRASMVTVPDLVEG
jgi:RNA polymerase sigma-70 factor (sigma-E family)